MKMDKRNLSRRAFLGSMAAIGAAFVAVRRVSEPA